MLPVKICGVTRMEDAALAAQLGATWVGFIFWPGSPRFVEPDAAGAILCKLPPHVTGVGVFVDQSVDEINSIADQVGLGAVQLHGDESVADCDRCRRRVIKGVGLSQERGSTYWKNVPSHATILVDAFDPIRRGGTGRVVDWAIAASIAGERPTILSGGLRAENVGEAVQHVSPYGLDVSSGIESEPGIKDHKLMRMFFQAVRATTMSEMREAATVEGRNDNDRGQ